MSTQTALNSTTPSCDQVRDEEDLKTLKLQESDLDRFATYFELAFQGNVRCLTVLVALLQRLCAVEKLRQQKQNGIWIEDIVGRLTHRLYTRCAPGFEAASRFGNEASDRAEDIFAEALLSADKSPTSLPPKPE
jgi:hypothetical protein